MSGKLFCSKGKGAWRVSCAEGLGVSSFPSAFSAVCPKKCKQQKKRYVTPYAFIRQFSAKKKK